MCIRTYDVWSSRCNQRCRLGSHSMEVLAENVTELSLGVRAPHLVCSIQDLKEEACSLVAGEGEGWVYNT
jgi:hypothetical protein